MHPAASIIVFTTLSGAGFGLMAWLGLGFGEQSRAFALLACGLALVLVSAGLVASFWHLGNPQRAWRALSQWRTSWLSREGVLAVATFGVFGLYTLLWAGGFGRIRLLGFLAVFLALATVFATSMIYTSLKAIPRWSKSPTPILFLSYALAGGALALAALTLAFDKTHTALLPVTAALILVAASISLWWTWRASWIGLDADGSTPETAIGLPDLGRARLFEAPHTAPNYLMKEMVFQVGRKHAEKLRRLAFHGAFIFPLLCLSVAAIASALAPIFVIGFLVHLLGVATSRWLFFAEAQHVVSLYYGHR